MSLRRFPGQGCLKNTGLHVLSVTECVSALQALQMPGQVWWTFPSLLKQLNPPFVGMVVMGVQFGYWSRCPSCSQTCGKEIVACTVHIGDQGPKVPLLIPALGGRSGRSHSSGPPPASPALSSCPRSLILLLGEPGQGQLSSCQSFCPILLPQLLIGVTDDSILRPITFCGLRKVKKRSKKNQNK